MNIFKGQEEDFLRGPRERWRELRYTIQVVFQFIRGFRALHFMGPCITVFGSARFKEDHPYYKLARDVSREISKLGFTIMTGGGPGIMEAANRGAKDAGGLSLGCNIVLEHEQHPNPYLDKYVNIQFFFVRKELLRKYSFAFIVMPGGFGTLDEFFETITLIETKKTEPFPVVIMGLEYHKHLIEHVQTMVLEQTISEEDSKLVIWTDSVEEAIQHINNCTMRMPDSIKLKRKHKPMWLLGEKHIERKAS